MKHYAFSRAVKNTSVFLGGLWTALLAIGFWLATCFLLLIVYAWRVGPVDK